MDNKKTVFVLANITKLRAFGTTTLCKMLSDQRGTLTCHLNVMKTPFGQLCADIIFKGDEVNKENRTFTAFLSDLVLIKEKVKQVKHKEGIIDELSHFYNTLRGETDLTDYRSKSTAKSYSLKYYIETEAIKSQIEAYPHFELRKSVEENEECLKSCITEPSGGKVIGFE